MKAKFIMFCSQVNERYFKTFLYPSRFLFVLMLMVLINIVTSL